MSEMEKFRSSLTELGIEYQEMDSQFVMCTRVDGGGKFVEHRKTGYTRYDAEGVDAARAVAMLLVQLSRKDGE